MESNWYNIFTPLIYDIIDSTNTEAIRIAQRNNTQNFLIWAGSQTKGKGKSGRNWSSEAGNLSFSLLLNQTIPLERSSQLVYVTAVALVSTLRTLTNLDFYLKWPNDIMLNNAKCAGILLESQIKANSNLCKFVVIGIGLNVKSSPELSSPTAHKATSLLEEGIYLENNTIIEHFMNNFINCYDEWTRNGFSVIRDLWMKYAYNINSVVAIHKNNDIISGTFKGIDHNGLLIVTLENGTDTLISTGDIFFDF